MRRYDSEVQTIEQVAGEYQRAGYDVVIRPDREQLPNALRAFQPDLLAKSAEETVVIEVKSRRELVSERQIASLAETIQSLKGWRLEVRVLEVPRYRREQAVLPMSVDEASHRLESATLLLSRKDYGSALVLAWSAFEAALRQLSWQADIAVAPWNAPRALKQLFSIGALSRSDYDLFMRGLEARNHVVHGGTAPRQADSLVRTVVSTVRRLLSEASPETEHSKGLTTRSSGQSLRARR
jgi:hypothetical protein